MKKIDRICLLLFLTVCFSLSGLPFLTVYSEEIEQIETKAGVGLYDSNSVEQSKEPSSITSTQEQVKKPKGKYPSTGELVKKSIAISGSALTILSLLLFFWKRKKRKQPKGKRGN